MCDFEQGFVLCSCREVPKTPIRVRKSKRPLEPAVDESGKYQWFLSEFVAYDEAILKEGIYELPIRDIGKGLTAEWVLLHLNEGNCFDFDYAPKPGDNLVIKGICTKYDFPHLSFIFRDDLWIESHYPPFCTQVRRMRLGIVQAVM